MSTLEGNVDNEAGSTQGRVDNDPMDYSQIFEGTPTQSGTTYIEVIKQLTPSITFKDSGDSFPAAEDSSSNKVVTQREKERNSVLSDRGSVLTSSQHTDSGYDTGRNSSSTSYHSELVTSNERVSVVGGQQDTEKDDELVTTLLEDIASLTENVQSGVTEKSNSCNTRPSNLSDSAQPNHLSSHDVRQQTNSKFDSEFRKNAEHRDLKTSFSPSPQGSPATPRRFKSPDCIRTRGMDFEEKWCYFETITSPPEEFRDVSPDRKTSNAIIRNTSPDRKSRSTSASQDTLSLMQANHLASFYPMSSNASSCETIGTCESINTDSILNTSESTCKSRSDFMQMSFSADCLMSADVYLNSFPNQVPQIYLPNPKVFDSNNNRPSFTHGASHKAAPEPSCIPQVTDQQFPQIRRTVRRAHRPKQNAGTNTESSPGKSLLPSRRIINAQTYGLDIPICSQDSKVSTTGQPSNTELLKGATSESSLTKGNIKVTSPILKRLFSTTMARGLQVWQVVISRCMRVSVLL